jgi:hypothetical protein
VRCVADAEHARARTLGAGHTGDTSRDKIIRGRASA